MGFTSTGSFFAGGSNGFTSCAILVTGGQHLYALVDGRGQAPLSWGGNGARGYGGGGMSIPCGTALGGGGGTVSNPTHQRNRCCDWVGSSTVTLVTKGGDGYIILSISPYSSSYQLIGGKCYPCAAGYHMNSGVCTICPVGSCCLDYLTAATACPGSMSQGATVLAGKELIRITSDTFLFTHFLMTMADF